MSDLNHAVPRRLDDEGKFLFWHFDVAGVFVCCLFAGVFLEKPVIGLVAGLVGAFLYQKLKIGQHPGMSKHILYWFTGIPDTKELPSSHLREFNG